MVILNTVYGR